MGIGPYLDIYTQQLCTLIPSRKQNGRNNLVKSVSMGIFFTPFFIFSLVVKITVITHHKAYL